MTDAGERLVPFVKAFVPEVDLAAGGDRHRIRHPVCSILTRRNDTGERRCR